MASWSQLPSDFKKSVVGHLDLISRNRLKICSTSDRKLVNSVPLTFKNARVGISDTLCLLMVHTGIDEFVKIDLKKVKDGVVLRRAMNTLDLTPAPWIPTVHKDILVALCLFMKSLLTSPSNNIFLEAFEWELNGYEDVFHLSQRLNSLFRRIGINFRAKKLVFNHDINRGFIGIVADSCMKKELKYLEKRSVAPKAERSLPYYVMDTFYPKFYNGLTLRFSRISLVYNSHEEMVRAMCLTLLHEPENAYMTFRPCRGPDDVSFTNDEYTRTIGRVRSKRYDLMGIVTFQNMSPCGFWITMIRSSKEHTVNWAAETCGLGDYCLECAGIFAHCYFLNLPRRIVTEPEWINVYCTVLNKKERDGYFSKLTVVIKEDQKQEALWMERFMEEIAADEAKKMKVEEKQKVEILKLSGVKVDSEPLSEDVKVESLDQKMESMESESKANHALNYELNTDSTANPETAHFISKALGTHEDPEDSTSSNISKFLFFSLFLIICISTPTILAFTIWPLLPDNVQSATSSYCLFSIDSSAYLTYVSGSLYSDSK